MQIICKYKDFYDYKCYEYGRDPFPTFDRRKCIFLNQSRLTEWIIDLKNNKFFFDTHNHYKNFYGYDPNDNIYFYLEVGRDKYIFKASNFSRKENPPKSQLFEYDSVICPIRIIQSTDKVWPAVMALSKIEKEHKMWRKYNPGEIAICEEKDLDYGNRNNYLGRRNKDDVINHPILSETKLTSLLDPLEIYKSLDSYLRSLNSDISRESSGLTDKEKAVNKGFNEKESFRNIHPRSI